jgi:hypothetical protein
MRLPTPHGVRLRVLLALAVLLARGQTVSYATLEKLGYPKRGSRLCRVRQRS